MKIDQYGKAKILTQAEIQLPFSQGLPTQRDRALFGICLFCACRINEAVTLQVADVYAPNGQVRPELIIRKGSTKGKLATRTIPVFEDLRSLLTSYQAPSKSLYLFPGLDGHNPINVDSAARVFKKACLRVGIYGASTHSLRRTALTQMSDAGIPLRIVQEVSGHRNLSQLQKYLEVRPDQVRGAIASLAMISPVGNPSQQPGESDGKCTFKFFVSPILKWVSRFFLKELEVGVGLRVKRVSESFHLSSVSQFV
jgi:integrase/recombinase XerD